MENLKKTLENDGDIIKISTRTPMGALKHFLFPFSNEKRDEILNSQWVKFPANEVFGYTFVNHANRKFTDKKSDKMQIEGGVADFTSFIRQTDIVQVELLGKDSVIYSEIKTFTMDILTQIQHKKSGIIIPESPELVLAK